MKLPKRFPIRLNVFLPGALVLAAAGSALVTREPKSPDGRLRRVASLAVREARTPRIRLEPLGEAPMPASAVSFTLAGPVLYACLSQAGLATYDVSDPTQPALARRLVGLRRADDPEGRVFLKVLAEKERLLVADRLRGLAVYDASDPLSPTLRWSRRIPGDNNNQPVSVDRIGDWYYLACGGGGLRVLPVDFGPETEPRPVLRQFDHTRQTLMLEPSWALVTDGYDTGMQVLDARDPAHPRVAHVFQTGTFCDQVLSGGAFAVISNRSMGLTLVDLRDPASPFVANYFHTELEDRTTIKSMALWKGRFLFAGNASRYIDVFDLMDPHRPILEDRIAVEGDVNVMAIQDDRLFVSFWSLNLLRVYRLVLEEAA